jgi:hypothetical protein
MTDCSPVAAVGRLKPARAIAPGVHHGAAEPPSWLGCSRVLVAVDGAEDVLGGSEAPAAPDTLVVAAHPGSITQSPMTRLGPIRLATPLTVRPRSRSTERRALGVAPRLADPLGSLLPHGDPFG